MLAGRYRIVGLLGRGGMGEVYRGDDLKLDQPVALKFLPEALEQDPARLARFLNEVKLARQVSHASVCRVYDVQEIEGHHFLSMEYVDGEDLASLLRRIGRLPQDKAVEIARQICAGLAAAHEQGILHRDLKPANVMIDGRGRAKITDFGLAEFAGGIETDDLRAGTPAYMAPEQIAGRDVTVRSDVYALGLVLYELFTGKRAFDAATPAEHVPLRQDSKPTSPSSHVEGLDSKVERAILRCLESDPRNRPPSALAVAGFLPGGDPLAAALAAGETPSPEMVADAGGKGGLHPGAGVACIAVILAGLALLVMLPPSALLVEHVPRGKPPQVLSDRARELVVRLGYPDPPADSATGLWWDSLYLDHVEAEDKSPRRWATLANGQPPVGLFWYRQSPRMLVPWNPFGSVDYWDDPPQDLSGMVSAIFDLQGRLVVLDAIPPQLDRSEDAAPEADWPVLFAAAGLNPAKFTPVRPDWVPNEFADSRAAWEGLYPDNAAVKIRIEAGAYRGKPVFFRVRRPWDRPMRMEELLSSGRRTAIVFAFVVLLAVLVGAVMLARRNLRTGRADRRGAFKVAQFMFWVWVAVWICTGHHVPEMQEAGLLANTFAWALLLGGFSWASYLALEPFLRRRLPDTIVSWNRLLAGRLRDPLIGRSILLGAAAGIILNLCRELSWLSTSWLGLPPPVPSPMQLPSFLGGRQLAGSLVFSSFLAVAIPLMYLLSIVLLKVLLRRQWLANVAFVLVYAMPVGSDNPILDAVQGALLGALVVFLLVRLGLLAACVAQLVSQWITIPLTLDFTAWYAGAGLASHLCVLGLVAYGFIICRAGRPLLRDAVLDV